MNRRRFAVRLLSALVGALAVAFLPSTVWAAEKPAPTVTVTVTEPAPTVTVTAPPATVELAETDRQALRSLAEADADGSAQRVSLDLSDDQMTLAVVGVALIVTTMAAGVGVVMLRG